MKANSSLERPSRIVVLHTPAREGLDGSVVHLNPYARSHFALGHRESGSKIIVEAERVCSG
jgi:hypothetical protein